MYLPKTYEPSQYEANIYALWEKYGAFEPADRGGKGYFSEVLPPPNANGNLHMGHALTVAIEDALARYHRMQGRPTMFVPGADHAGFETWVVYEKKLNQEGKSRFDFSREELYRQVWDFVQSNKQGFETQLRALGASVDWTRFTFTLDDKVVKTAYETFNKMWQDGLIYRGQRIVNYCTFHGTSFSDIEVLHKEEQSKLWHIKYPLADGSGYITVATTRPETMLGDTAVAVNPKDDRYMPVVGKSVKLPLTNREIPIVADDMVDPKFGSGAVKITPAHDPNDYEVAIRHKLPFISVIGSDGKITHEAPPDYQNLAIHEARNKVLFDLQKIGQLKDEQDYTHSVGHCYKCDTVIEPLLQEQWFVNMRPLVEKAVERLQKNEVTFYPASKKTEAIRYLKDVKDWNISRQIAWGIPIPAFQNVENPKDWIFDTRVKEEVIEVNGKKYKRDPDTFDTWFSSSQWPYVTLDYPESEDFKNFYPLSVMETGNDILYQWVTRMLILGVYRTEKVPFKNVYIHGYVRAEDGTKMSKSKGNTIDPMPVLQQYGSDALRMGLLSGRRPGVNQAFHPAKIQGGRNFCNKLWNIARYIEAKVGDDSHLKVSPEPKNSADHWILNKLSISEKEMSNALEHYRISEAFEVMYDFVWHDFADWYIEASKAETNVSVLAYVLESTLKLAHPFAPFVTETIWQTLAWENTLLATEVWPKNIHADKKKADEFDEVINIVSDSRQIIKTLNLKKPPLSYQDSAVIADNAVLITKMANLSGATEAPKDAKQGLRLTNTENIAWMEIERSIAEKYLDSLVQQKLQRKAAIELLNKRLANHDYVSKAPKELVDQTRKKLEEEERMLNAVTEESIRYIKIVQRNPEDDDF